MFKIEIKEMFFFNSSKESIINILGNIGKNSDGGYLIKEGIYDIDISLEKLLELSVKHEILVLFKNGNIILE
jgi:hypothetical protein